MCRDLHGIEIPGRDFRRKVALRRLDAAFCGKRDLYQKRRFADIEVKYILRRGDALRFRHLLCRRAFAAEFDDKRIVALNPLAAMVPA